VEAANAVAATSLLANGGVVACGDDDGGASFEMLGRCQHQARALVSVFDLRLLNGKQATRHFGTGVGGGVRRSIP
jgi:hypothetical protein